jgi:hypothetical protein
MNQQQARIALSLVIPIVTLMVFSPALAVKAVTSGSNSATAGNGVATSSNGHCTATAGNGKVSIVCTPICPPGMNGTPSTEDSDPPQTEGDPNFDGNPPDVAASGSCFHSGEDEPSGSEERAETVS